MHDLAGDVAEVMDQLDLEPAWVAGHAFGNRVARAVALDHGQQLADDFPEQVRLVPIEGAGHLFPFLQPEATARAILDHL